MVDKGYTKAAEDLFREADRLRRSFSGSFRDDVVQDIFADAEKIAARAVISKNGDGLRLGHQLDMLLTSPVFGLPVMAALLAFVFWLTISGSNVPSQLLGDFLFKVEDKAASVFDALGSPWWLTGFIWHGVYRGLAWVVAVMLPPMAIFFPCFTILEDLGFLPRIAFNLDWLFQKAGAHGKQALTMCMGFGCNAAGITACRIIRSPRERLIAILTNNFVPCNGRFPTLILLATIFVAARFPAGWASVAAAGSVFLIVIIGVVFTLVVSAVLSNTVLKGQPSAFALELPPYRRPGIIRILYTSLIDRTIFVLLRAMATAAPAGGIIWLLGNIHVGGASLAVHVAHFLNPLGYAIGLDGVILLAYIIAIPANEIVVPTMLMIYSGSAVMTEDISMTSLRSLLVDQNNWTLLTAVNLMLFSLLHNPCATTIITIWKETRSAKWTALGALMPLVLAFAVTFFTAQSVRLLFF